MLAPVRVPPRGGRGGRRRRRRARAEGRVRVRGGRPRRRPRRTGEAQAVPRTQPVDGARPRRFGAAARAAARFHALRGFPSSRVLGFLLRVAADDGRPGLRLDGRRVEAHVDAAVGAGDDLHACTTLPGECSCCSESCPFVGGGHWLLESLQRRCPEKRNAATAALLDARALRGAAGVSCNAAAQGSEKRRRSCPFGGGHARLAAGEYGCECWWFLVQNCARLRRKTRRSPRR